MDRHMADMILSLSGSDLGRRWMENWDCHEAKKVNMCNLHLYVIHGWKLRPFALPWLQHVGSASIMADGTRHFIRSILGVNAWESN